MAEYIKREDAMKALDEYRLSQTMSKFGDRELLMEYRDGVVGAMNELAFVPAADVVEVVRCKDCKWWEAWITGSTVGRCENPRNGLVSEYSEDDDFCSYGERKE